MKNPSRREFFRKFGHDLADQIDLGAALPPQPESTWVPVGRMADFVPGVSRKVELGGVTLTLNSIAEGFWAELEESIRVALQTVAGGTVRVNVNMRWPRDRMLSHLTGEVVELEPQGQSTTTGEDK